MSMLSHIKKGQRTIPNSWHVIRGAAQNPKLAAGMGVRDGQNTENLGTVGEIGIWCAY